jgi:hypothetical protein
MLSGITIITNGSHTQDIRCKKERGGDMARHIAGYEAAWHPDKHRGVIFLEFADGGKARLDAKDAAEFSALLSVLRHGSAVIGSEGWIQTRKAELE